MNTSKQVRSWRSRQQAWSRRLIAETRLEASDFIIPIVITSGSNVIRPIKELPGINAYSLDQIWSILDNVIDFGIPSVMLVPEFDLCKAPNSFEIIAALQEQFLPKIAEKKLPLGLMVDVNFQQVNHLASDGLLKDGRIVYERTVEALVQQAVCLSEAGASSIIMPGHLVNCVSETRHVLNKNELTDVVLISHAANYASSFSVPSHVLGNEFWTDALHSSDYLLDIANGNEAEREALADTAEGADWLMVQPAGISQDIIYRVSRCSHLPVIAYHLSGEYFQARLYAEARHLNPTRVMYEAMLAIKRSGASAICTLAALDVVQEIHGLSSL